MVPPNNCGKYVSLYVGSSLFYDEEDVITTGGGLRRISWLHSVVKGGSFKFIFPFDVVGQAHSGEGGEMSVKKCGPSKNLLLFRLTLIRITIISQWNAQEEDIIAL